MEHFRDAHCTLDENDTCIDCGVYHGDPCPDCGNRAFHADDCKYHDSGSCCPKCGAYDYCGDTCPDCDYKF